MTILLTDILEGIIGIGNVIDDNSTNSDNFYITMAQDQTSGSYRNVIVSSSTLYFNPSTGNLTVGQAMISNGNLQISIENKGIVFSDGSFQTTASDGSAATGGTGAIQYADGTALAGDNTLFFFDGTNKIGIGTNDVSQSSIHVKASLPALFDTASGDDRQLRVGNSATTAATLGYNTSAAAGYLRSNPSGTNMITWSGSGVGINGVDTPANALDVSGAVVIGSGGAYAGSAIAPTNGLLVQGSVGLGTTSTGTNVKLGVYGGNIVVGDTGYGIVFSDGTFMDSASGADYNQSVFTHTGDGGTTGFSTSPLTASSVNNTMVYVNGVYQRKSTYTWSGTTLTFASAPANQARIEINVVDSASSSFSSTNFQASGNIMVLGNQPSYFADDVGIGTSSTDGIDNRLTVFGNINIVGTDGALLINGTPFSGGTSISVTDDTSTNANTYYPSLTNNVTSGTLSALTTSSTKLYFNPSTGTLNATVFNSLSDATMKTNIAAITDSGTILDSIRGVRFRWTDNGTSSAGLIAQDVESVMPELVNTTEQGKSLNYNGIIGVLVEAIKDLKDEVAELRRRLDG
jgi:hypothetical protein